MNPLLKPCHRYRDGWTKHPSYGSWHAMIYRCYNPKDGSFERYGGNGIRVSKRWHDFRLFVEDMGVRPKGLTLERKNGGRSYTKRNCCWATVHDQTRNKCSNIWIRFKGRRMILKDWCKECGTNYYTAYWRYRQGWSPSAILRRVS